MKVGDFEILRSDVYQIIVPILIVIINIVVEVYKIIKQNYKHWNCIKNPSSQQQYVKYFIFYIIFGFLFAILYSAFLLAFATSMNIVIRINTGISIWIIILYIVFNTIAHVGIGIAVFVHCKTYTILKFKKEYKHRKKMEYFFYFSPIIIGWIMWNGSILFSGRVLNAILLVLFVFSEVLIYYTLDDKRIVEYEYATFYLKDDTIIPRADVNTTYKKGDWIVVKFKDNPKEIRIRHEDIRRIEYKNLK